MQLLCEKMKTSACERHRTIVTWQSRNNFPGGVQKHWESPAVLHGPAHPAVPSRCCPCLPARGREWPTSLALQSGYVDWQEDKWAAPCPLLWPAASFADTHLKVWITNITMSKTQQQKNKNMLCSGIFPPAANNKVQVQLRINKMHI